MTPTPPGSSRAWRTSTGLDRLAASLTTDITAAEHQAQRARAEQDTPFPHAAQLTAARERASALAREMTDRAIAADQPPAPDATPTADTTPAASTPSAENATVEQDNLTTDTAQIPGATRDPTAAATATSVPGARGGADEAAPGRVDTAGVGPQAVPPSLASTAATPDAQRAVPGELTAAVRAWRRRCDVDPDGIGTGPETGQGAGLGAEASRSAQHRGHGLR